MGDNWREAYERSQWRGKQPYDSREQLDRAMDRRFGDDNWRFKGGKNWTPIRSVTIDGGTSYHEHIDPKGGESNWTTENPDQVRMVFVRNQSDPQPKPDRGPVFTQKDREKADRLNLRLDKAEDNLYGPRNGGGSSGGRGPIDPPPANPRHPRDPNSSRPPRTRPNDGSDYRGNPFLDPSYDGISDVERVVQQMSRDSKLGIRRLFDYGQAYGAVSGNELFNFAKTLPKAPKPVTPKQLLNMARSAYEFSN